MAKQSTKHSTTSVNLASRTFQHVVGSFQRVLKHSQMFIYKIFHCFLEKKIELMKKAHLYCENST